MDVEAADKENTKEARWENEAIMYEIESMKVTDVSNSWYSDLKHYLSKGSTLVGLDARRHGSLLLKSTRYQLVSRLLLKRNFDNVLLRCLKREESEKSHI